jgi:uncharacterized protein (DUF433 family)
LRHYIPLCRSGAFLVVSIEPGYDDSEVQIMAALDWSQCPAVESVPERRSGAWVFRGTRMPVATVFENLEAGSSIEEIVEQFHVTPAQIQSVLDFVARSLDEPPASVATDQRSHAYSL